MFPGFATEIFLSTLTHLKLEFSDIADLGLSKPGLEDSLDVLNI